MRRLAKPAINTGQHFSSCASATRDASVRGRLLASAPAILAAEGQYETAGGSAAFYALVPITTLASGEELRGMYTRSMQPLAAVGRGVYDHLLLSAPNGICPLCEQRTVSSLDHYLPQSVFPEFSIVAINLIPACADCNRSKWSHTPAGAADQILHPYYDVLEEGQWLQATVHDGGCSPALSFFVDPPGNWPPTLRARVLKHFDVLALGKLYASHAAEEMTNIAHRLRAVRVAGGPDAVREHLMEEAASRSAVAPNSWQAVTYRVLAADLGYCSGGFDN